MTGEETWPRIQVRTPRTPLHTHRRRDHRCGCFQCRFGVQNLEDVRRRDPELSQLWNDANQVEDGQPQMAPSVATMWHVAIQTYNDGVPAHEVAAFLINSAEWGVRSVELFGQTTYYSRSFIDLKQAQTMLEDIRSEGFTQAKVEALN